MRPGFTLNNSPHRQHFAVELLRQYFLRQAVGVSLTHVTHLLLGETGPVSPSLVHPQVAFVIDFFGLLNCPKRRSTLTTFAEPPRLCPVFAPHN